MDRRQVLQALNAIGVCTVLPASAFSSGDSSLVTHMAVPPLIEDRAAVKVADTGWDLPKIGILSVGGIGGTYLPRQSNLAQSLPYLNRTIAIETSGIELSFMEADRKLLVGDGKTLLNPHAARLLAESAIHEIADAVAGLDMVLLVAGMGGNTGTGIAPIVAQVLRNQGILTLVFAVMPFDCEGQQRQQIAQAGIRELRHHVDALIPFFNNDIDPDVRKVRWLSPAAQQAPLTFIEVCRNIMNPVCRPGLVNIDFGDLRHIILSQEGDCAFGFGSASGLNGAEVAARQAIEHPFLGQSRLQWASAVLVAIESRPHPQALLLRESKNVTYSVRKLLSPQADIFYSVTVQPDGDNRLDSGDFRVSILANGIQEA